MTAPVTIPLTQGVDAFAYPETSEAPRRLPEWPVSQPAPTAGAGPDPLVDADSAALIAAQALDLDIAVLLPCYNEEVAIARVIEEFRSALPHATIYVYDNNSSDQTARIAREMGAVVRTETRQGKGYVVRRMFADISAEVYVLCDADSTYDAGACPRLIAHLAQEGLDMVVGSRSAVEDLAYRPGHAFGNRMLTGMVQKVFGNGFDDMLRGFRVFSRRFVKSFPATSTGFEIETELTIHSLELEMPATEICTRFRDRPAGSESKLDTISDGIRIVRTIASLLKQERPFTVFGAAAGLLGALSLALGYPVITEFLSTGLVPRFPTAILASGLMVLAFLFLFSGLILDSVSRGRKEAKRLKYLEFQGIHELLESRRKAASRV